MIGDKGVKVGDQIDSDAVISDKGVKVINYSATPARPPSRPDELRITMGVKVESAGIGL